MSVKYLSEKDCQLIVESFMPKPVENSLVQRQAIYDLSKKSLTGEPVVQEALGHFSRNYYSKEINKINFTSKDKGFGYCAQVASFETAIALGLMSLERSPAIIANLATTLTEFMQVGVAGFSEELEGKAKPFMAGLTVLGGGVGIGKLLWDVFKSFQGEANEHDDASLFKKITLTAGSAISSVLMFFNSGEKHLLSKLDSNGENTRDMATDARQDSRCSLEWLSMIPYIWSSNFKPFKVLVDIALPMLAVVDGLHELELTKFKLPEISGSIFNSKFYLGSADSQGLRSKIFVPIMRSVYHYQPPKAHLDSAGNIVAYVDMKADQAKAAISHSNNPGDDTGSSSYSSSPNPTPSPIHVSGAITS